MITAILQFPHISPEIAGFSLFGMNFQIRWYGLFYVISFVLGYFLYKRNLRLRNVILEREHYESALFTVMLGVILGGRLGYVIFYNLLYYLQNPLAVFAVWEGGMSFHGGALGVIIGGLIFAHRHKLNFYKLADAAVPLVAIGLGLGRMGNFINGELWGRVSNLPWAMVFPDGGPSPRHPSQLYELILEGIVLALACQYLLPRVKKDGVVFWVFIGLYGIFRFMIEFVRVPDVLDFYDKFGYILGFMSIGQFLSLLMIIVSGAALYLINRKKGEPTDVQA